MSIRGKGEARHFIGVSFEALPLLLGVEVPKTNGSILARRCSDTAIGREGQIADSLGMTLPGGCRYLLALAVLRTFTQREDTLQFRIVVLKDLSLHRATTGAQRTQCARKFRRARKSSKKSLRRQAEFGGSFAKIKHAFIAKRSSPNRF